MTIVTGDRYLESLVKFVEEQAGPLIEGSLVLKLNPVGLHYVHSRLEALAELESLLFGAPIDYLRAYVSDLGDHRALEQLRRILRLLTSLKVVSVLPSPARDPTPLSLLPFGRLKVLELRGCDLSTSAARGLLELRHTLEKLICHNSTDALRHVFASRIAEIKESPQWNRLSFVSCACNGLVVMDESLRLLPVVENLDLSRNKFAKVDNLWKCTKLRQLDLGFNHLRTMSSFSEVALQIVKLVLRNNALTTLRGIENLKFLEAMDLSYNVISNLAELETIAGLPSLQSFWLEGNPLCCTQWYRAQVFSFFPHPYKLKLDEKHMSTRESWQRRIIIASRQKRPASFGFYSPAKDSTEFEGSINIKRKKLSRLASIETEELSTAFNSDQESVICDNEIRSKEENAMSDKEADMNDLMHRIEYTKKEHSIQWLQEFKEWMSNPYDSLIDNTRYSDLMAYPEKENYYENKIRHKHQGETSRYISDSIQPSGNESSTDFIDSVNSFADTCISGSDSQYFDRVAEAASKLYRGHSSRDSLPSNERKNSNEGHMKSYYNETSRNIKSRDSFIDSFATVVDRMGGKDISIYLTAIDDIMESHSFSAYPGSPPHYQEAILHLRQNLEKEVLQLSAESLSLVSSDSDTSNSEDESAEVGPFMPHGLPLFKLSERSTDDFSSMPYSGITYHYGKNEISRLVQNGRCSIESGTRQPSTALAQLGGNTLSAEHGNVHPIKREDDWSQKKNCKRRPKRRLVSLSEEDNMPNDTEPSRNLNEKLNVYNGDIEGEKVHLDGNLQNLVAKRYTWKGAITASFISDGGTIISKSKSSSPGRGDFIENYFNSNVADCGVNETCRQYIFCNFILEEASGGVESEGAILLSSEYKIYFILINNTYDSSAPSLKLTGGHRVEDVKEVLVSLGLQIVRLFIERETTHLFITRSMEKSRQLLSILGFSDSYVTKNNISLRSMEQVQVNLLENNICGGMKRGIFQYAMVLFWHNNLEEDLWLSRSLFVLEEQLLIFVEDFIQFGSFSDNASSLSYFVLDSCCSIIDVCEMVIEATGSRCVTLALECALSDVCPADKANKVKGSALTVEKPASNRLIWKIKWFSKESLFNFVALLKTFHDAAAEYPLVVRCLS